MIIHNFHVFRVAIFGPDEADAELIVNSEAMLAAPIPFEGFQPVTGNRGKIGERPRLIEMQELAPSGLFDCLIGLRELIPEKFLRLSIPECPNHVFSVYR